MATDIEDVRNSSIALFFPTFTPGGIERCMLNLAEGFVDRGIDVDLVVADRRGSFESKVPSETTIVNLKVNRVLKSVFPLVKYLRERNPDVLLSGHTHANLIAVWSGKLSRTDTKIAIGVHNPHSENYNSEKTLKPRIVRNLFPITYEYADEIIAVSHGIAEDLVEITNLARDQISVIYNPVVGGELQELSHESVSHPWLENEELHVVMGAGRLSPEKDFETLIRSFQSIFDTLPNARLIIAGDGDERTKLENLTNQLDISDVVDFTGYLENPYAFMKASDVFVVSSKWEGFGIVLVEAMAVGTPVVSTDCPTGPAEILNEGQYGELVSVGDHDELAQAVFRTLNEPPATELLASWSSQFHIDEITDEYINILGGYFSEEN